MGRVARAARVSDRLLHHFNYPKETQMTDFRRARERNERTRMESQS
jgi:hypothetical protein